MEEIKNVENNETIESEVDTEETGYPEEESSEGGLGTIAGIFLTGVVGGIVVDKVVIPAGKKLGQKIVSGVSGIFKKKPDETIDEDETENESVPEEDDSEEDEDEE